MKVAPLGPDGDGAQYLEYRRVGNRFRIAVVWGWENDPENETVKPWSDCSRDDKLETLKKLPDLLVALTENVDTRITEAEATMESISAVLDPLKVEGGA
ncbi:hypothetical protein [Roseiconus lacunae]|uniref:Uncharacterized protein n=1 Tax=Roseiconus lacunae TaxID=2605694 RepID=A0ABT7PEQ3_9BACT|nr:hypothetical protein [Roseiconus lacunae]MDM4014982.1 hypothetical protein [Roseiconus lacunae]